MPLDISEYSEVKSTLFLTHVPCIKLPKLTVFYSLSVKNASCFTRLLNVLFAATYTMASFRVFCSKVWLKLKRLTFNKRCTWDLTLHISPAADLTLLCVTIYHPTVNASSPDIFWSHLDYFKSSQGFLGQKWTDLTLFCVTIHHLPAAGYKCLFSQYILVPLQLFLASKGQLLSSASGLNKFAHFTCWHSSVPPFIIMLQVSQCTFSRYLYPNPTISESTFCVQVRECIILDCFTRFYRSLSETLTSLYSRFDLSLKPATFLACFR